MRVPTINVSLVDLTFTAKRATTVQEINQAVRNAAAGALRGVLAYNEAPLVSVDFNHDPHSSIFDATLTKVIGGTLVKVVRLVRQRVGLLQPHDRYDARLGQGVMKVLRMTDLDLRGKRVLIREDLNVPGSGRRRHQRCAHPRGAADASAVRSTRAPRFSSSRISAAPRRASSTRRCR